MEDKINEHKLTIKKQNEEIKDINDTLYIHKSRVSNLEGNFYCIRNFNSRAIIGNLNCRSLFLDF